MQVDTVKALLWNCKSIRNSLKRNFLIQMLDKDYVIMAFLSGKFMSREDKKFLSSKRINRAEWSNEKKRDLHFGEVDLECDGNYINERLKRQVY